MRTIAAFDFDGTLTRRDTLFPFLRGVVGLRRLAVAVLADLPRLAAGALGRGDRDAAKARLFARVLAGRDAVVLAEQGRRYANHVLNEALRPSVVARVRWHKEQGHEVALVSASLEPYLVIVGAALAFDLVVCTRLVVRDGLLTGAMDGRNCRGPEKLSRLLAAAGDPPPDELWAYGDSAGDDALLAAAQHAFRVARDGTIHAA